MDEMHLKLEMTKIFINILGIVLMLLVKLVSFSCF